jgi:hypothetical protein
MSRTLKRLFVDHPREVEETYFEHMAASSRFGLKLPGVFRTTVSDEIKATARTMTHRADEARECRMRDAGVWDPGL